MAQIDSNRLNRFKDFQKNNSSNTTFVKLNLFKIASGESIKVRILPALDDNSLDKDFFCRAIAHYKVHPTLQNIPVFCRKNVSPTENCPVCTKRQELKASGSDIDLAEADKIKPNVKYYMSLIPRDGKQANEILIYPAPRAILDKILALMQNDEYGDVTHPDEGFDGTITRTGEGRETKYDFTASRKESPIYADKTKQAEVLNNRPELWRFRIPPSEEEIANFMEGKINRFTTGGQPGQTTAVVEEGPSEEAAKPEASAEPKKVRAVKANIDKLKGMLED